MKVPGVFVKIVLAAVFLTVAAAVAQAEDKPLFSLDRASLAVGMDYAWYQAAGDEPVPTFSKAWEPGLFGAYVLTPHLTLTGSGRYDLDNKLVRWKVGVRAVIWRGRD